MFLQFVLSIAPPQRITAKNKSGGELLQRPISSGVQEYSSNKDRYPLSKPMVKLEALSQTSGTYFVLKLKYNVYIIFVLYYYCRTGRLHRRHA